MKSIIFAVLILVTFQFSVIAAPELQPEGIAAIVNSTVITFGEIRKKCLKDEEMLRKQYSGQDLVEKIRTRRLAAVNELVEEALILAEADREHPMTPSSMISEQQRAERVQAMRQINVLNRSTQPEERKRIESAWISRLKQENFVKVF